MCIISGVILIIVYYKINYIYQQIVMDDFNFCKDKIHIWLALTAMASNGTSYKCSVISKYFWYLFV